MVRITLHVLVTLSRLLCSVTFGITSTCQYLKNKRCGVEIVARFQRCVFLLLRKNAAWHWHLSYGLGVFAIHPLSVCDAIVEGVDKSQKMGVLTVMMNFRVNAS